MKFLLTITIIIFLVLISIAPEVYAFVTTFRKKPVTGRRGMIGKSGRVIETIEPDGKVFVRGEIWNARSESGGAIEKDVDIEVSNVDGLTLVVKIK